jgi:hypothetical protein
MCEASPTTNVIRGFMMRFNNPSSHKIHTQHINSSYVYTYLNQSADHNGHDDAPPRFSFCSASHQCCRQQRQAHSRHEPYAPTNTDTQAQPFYVSVYLPLSTMLQTRNQRRPLPKRVCLRQKFKLRGIVQCFPSRNAHSRRCQYPTSPTS